MNAATETRRPFCQDTYLDALNWSEDRRDAEIRGIVDFLNANYCRAWPEAMDPVIREMRAIKYAAADAAAGLNPYVL